MQCGILGAVCILVTGIYAYTSQLGDLELLTPNAADTCYNLLVQGFRAGQLSLNKEVPPEFALLADPYDPAANSPYRAAPYWMHDLSYYKGRLYLYFGVTPALILFWPVVALTGHYLFDQQAVAILCALGFLASVALLRALWRRYFSEVSVWVVAACALALGLATGALVLLLNSEVYQVAVSCGYMLTMLALAAIWCALHEPERRRWWLAAASVAYGLAVGARPNLLFGAVILLVPVAQAWRERWRIWAVLMAATGPIMLIGLGLMLYNSLRFDSPFEFGWHYQLGGEQHITQQRFSLHYLWFNLRVYFLEPARWSARFPFAHEIPVPPLPPGHLQVERPFGVLSNIPLVWLALAVPLAWRNRPAQAASILRWFVTGAALLFLICTLTIGLYNGASFRYQVDFLPTLVLLAVIGILGLERALAPTSKSGQACRPVWRCAMRWGWSLLVGFSVTFNLLASVGRCAEAYFNVGTSLMQVGRIQEAIGQYEQALRLNPDNAELHYHLGIARLISGEVQEAIRHWEQAVRIKPDHADAHNNLGVAFAQAGRFPEAIEQFDQVLRITANDAEVHCNLGNALMGLGKVPEAIGHYEQACQLTNDQLTPYLAALAAAYAAANRFDDAIVVAQKAIELARSAGQPQMVKEIEARLQLYRNGRAYDQSPNTTSPHRQ